MENLWGRRLLTKELEQVPKEVIQNVESKSVPAVIKKGRSIQCNRCSKRTRIRESRLSESSFYCPHCLFLGRCDTSQKLYLFGQPEGSPREVIFSWEGKLTARQRKIAVKLAAPDKRRHLVWAVTGSGKTEMLYESLLTALRAGGRVAVVSPRIDVCNELFLRFTAAFPEEQITLLHGKADEPYRYSPFVICTTHQLYRFYRAFDLLVIDEVDAFPYVGDPGLSYASDTAVKLQGKLIYLSATPDDQTLKKIKPSFEIHRLALRFHQRLLPEPQLVFWNNWRKNCLKPKKIRPLLKVIERLLEENHVLLFCPSIALMTSLKEILKVCLPHYRITDVSSRDEKRTRKVQKMRTESYDVLLSTMILERGVTFERVSVIVLGADHPSFTKSSLVQIAGRADRKGAFTNSQVYFYYEEKTRAIQKACREIKDMNREGEKLR